jgi:hypothetical protein
LLELKERQVIITTIATTTKIITITIKTIITTK